MAITALPTPPLRSDPTNFAARGDAFLSALPTFVTEANATAAAMNLNSTTDTSASSVLISTGAKTFVVSAGKSFQPGMYLVIADAAAPSTNSVFGQVTSYSGTSLVMNILTVRGSGTYASWVISQASAGGAQAGANSDITSLSGLSGTLRVGGVGQGKYLAFSNSNTQVMDLGVATGTGSGNDVGLFNMLSGNLVFGTNSAERMRIDTSGNVLVTGAGGLGYGAGAGGTVTQATSKSTAVTLNKPTGKITMNASALASNTAVTFLLNNSLIGFNDAVVVTCDGSTMVTRASYQVSCVDVGSSNCAIRVVNVSAGSLSEAVGINFAIIKGAAA